VLENAHRVPIDTLRDFCAALLRASGTPPDIALEVAHHLVESDAAGHASHGVIHLPSYLAQMADGAIDPTARPEVTRDTPTAALLDGHWGFGHFAAKLATDLAVSKATHQGISTVALIRTGHIGRLGEYTEVAANRGCVMLMMTAPIPGNQVVPPAGAEGVLGTNPISISFPDGRADPFCLDFATSAISGGKVWLAQQRGDEIPADVLLTPQMQPTRDPDWLHKGALFPPFGGHKGYALSVAIALLASALTGGGGVGERPVQAGTLVIAIHQGVFVERGVVAAIADAELSRISASKRAQPDKPIILPGEPEAAARVQARSSGVEITAPTRRELVVIAARLGVDSSPLQIAS
jgi:hydroxycarboxylate dehydrogenase B